MDKASHSSIERLGSSICQVCQGLGDLRNPRGALVEMPEGQRLDGHYHYIYMHHPSIAALVRSAKGCSICKVLCHDLRSGHATDFDQAAGVVSPALTTASKRVKSIMDAETSHDQAAAYLAEQVKSMTYFYDLDLGDIGKGRIIIQHSSHDKLGPRGTIDKLYTRVNLPNVDFLYGVLSGFQTSCRSIS